MELTTLQKAQALVSAGYLVADKANILPEEVIIFNFKALTKKLDEVQMSTYYPVGQKLVMDDGEDATCIGYNGLCAIFEQDTPKPKEYQISLDVLKSRGLVKE